MPVLPPSLGRRAVRVFRKQREAKAALAKKRWTTLDSVVTKGLAVLLGAVFVNFVTSFNDGALTTQAFYAVALIICIAVVPALLLILTHYEPPVSVTLTDQGQVLRFERLGDRSVSFYRDGKLLLHSVDSLKLVPDKSQIVLADSDEEAGLFVHTFAEWPGQKLALATMMVKEVSHGELKDCTFDLSLLSSKTLVQMLSWTIKDFIAAGTGHTWQESFGGDILFALLLYCFLWICTFLGKYFKLKSYKEYHHAPFAGPAFEHRCRNGWWQVLSSYCMVPIGSMPLSAGYAFNQVTLNVKGTILAELQMEHGPGTGDYKPSLDLFSDAIYFLAITFLSMFLKAYSSRLIRLWSPKLPLSFLSDQLTMPGCECRLCRPWTEAECLCEICKTPDVAPSVCAPADVEAHQELKRPEPEDATNLEGLPLKVEQLDRRLRKLEQAVVGARSQGDTPKPAAHVPVKGHLMTVILQTSDEVGLKTLQFVFGWAVLYLLEDFYYIYLLRCDSGSTPNFNMKCTYSQSLGFAFGLTLLTCFYLFALAGLSEQRKMHQAFFTLQIQAFPLIVGWAWKGFVDDVTDSLKVEWSQESVEIVHITLFFTLFIFCSMIFHIYSVISQEMRLKSAIELM